MKSFKLEKACNKYGAQMGRRDVLPDNRDAKGRLRLVRLRWVDGDYDFQGAYWGKSDKTNIYYCFGDLPNEEFTIKIFIRAENRKQAKELIRKILPNISFYN